MYNLCETSVRMFQIAKCSFCLPHSIHKRIKHMELPYNTKTYVDDEPHWGPFMTEV